MDVHCWFFRLPYIGYQDICLEDGHHLKMTKVLGWSFLFFMKGIYTVVSYLSNISLIYSKINRYVNIFLRVALSKDNPNIK